MSSEITKTASAGMSWTGQEQTGLVAGKRELLCLGAEGLSARAWTRVLTRAAAKGVEPMHAAKAKISAAERCSAALLLSDATFKTESASAPALCATSSLLPSSPTQYRKPLGCCLLRALSTLFICPECITECSISSDNYFHTSVGNSISVSEATRIHIQLQFPSLHLRHATTQHGSDSVTKECNLCLSAALERLSSVANV